MRKSIKFRTQAVIILCTLILTLTAILTLVIGKVSSSLAREDIGQSLAQTAFQMSDKLDYYMWSRIGEVNILNKLIDVDNIRNIESNQKALNDFKKIFPDFSWIGITDNKGTVLSATDGILVGKDISERPVYKGGKAGSFIGDVHDAVLLANLLPNPTGEAMKFVDISTTLRDKNGNFIGVLAAHLSWQWASKIEKAIMEPLASKDGVEIFVMSSNDGSVLLGPRSMIGKKLNLESVTKSKNGKSSWKLEKWDDGNNYVTGFSMGKGYMDYEGLGWTVLVRQPIDVAYAQVRKFQVFIAVLGVLCSIIFAVVGWFISGKIVDPIKKLTEAAKELKTGKNVQIPVSHGIKEIEVLSLSIRDLVDSLTKTEVDLEKMGEIAKLDHLTGLPNRVALENFIEGVRRREKTNITFLYIDLDNFKPVNDTYGHPVGDELLKEVSTRLKSCVKYTDMVSRLGGDEFLIALFTEEEPLVYSTKVAKSILSSLTTSFKIEDNEIKIGCSIGGAFWSVESQSSTEVIRCADEALYKAKRSGKNRIYFYSNDDFKLIVI